MEHHVDHFLTVHLDDSTRCPHVAHLTSRSRPAATVTMSPVSLLMVNMFWDGLWGVWVTIRYRTIPLAVVLSSASLAVTVITYVPGTDIRSDGDTRGRHLQWIPGLPMQQHVPAASLSTVWPGCCHLSAAAPERASSLPYSTRESPPKLSVPPTLF